VINLLTSELFVREIAELIGAFGEGSEVVGVMLPYILDVCLVDVLTIAALFVGRVFLVVPPGITLEFIIYLRLVLLARDHQRDHE